MEHARKDLEYHDDIAASYDETVVQPRVVTNDQIYRKVRQVLKRGDELLDLGCGTGHLTNRFGKLFKRVTAVDHSAGMLEFAKKHAALQKGLRVDFVRENALEYAARCETNRFDLIGCVGFLHHLLPNDLAFLLEQLYRIAKPDGLLILQEPIKIPLDSVPDVINKWNSTSVVTRMSYTNTAPHPDEEPLYLDSLNELLKSVGFEMKLALRSWEIFPKSFPPSLSDRFTISFLNWKFGATGNVYTIVARKL